MSFNYSLVVATCGRKKELELLLDSLMSQAVPATEFEVIIVDQNENDLILDSVKAYSSTLNIQHIRSARKGLSYNRNLGIKQARGKYIAVPDDDCVYYADTLLNAGQLLRQLHNPDMIIGRVFDRGRNTHVFKRTPQKLKQVNVYNFYNVVSSISMLFKNDRARFDENFGIGEKYHSNEDADLILYFLKTQKSVYYSPLVEFNHPPYNASTMSNDKLYRYGIGFGALCRKYVSAPLLFLFAKVIFFQVLMLLKACLTLNGVEAGRRATALKGRLKGFYLYRKG